MKYLLYEQGASLLTSSRGDYWYISKLLRSLAKARATGSQSHGLLVGFLNMKRPILPRITCCL